VSAVCQRCVSGVSAVCQRCVSGVSAVCPTAAQWLKERYDRNRVSRYRG